jgi:V/A-type H+/Na+-transporting ATPase subunit K
MDRFVYLVFAALISLSLVSAFAVRRSRHPKAALRTVLGGLLSFNGLAALVCLGLALVAFGSPASVLAQGTAATPTAGSASNTALGAALATGLACIGAGIGVGIAGAAAIGSITEKPEVLGRTLIFVGLAEGVAIYGLIISFMILSR